MIQIDFMEHHQDLNKWVKPDAKVISVNISDQKGIVKTPVDLGTFLVDFGLEGDAHGGNWHRMVSLLAQESYEKNSKAHGVDLAIGSYAENLTTSGIILHELPVGTKLAIGETLQEITQIGKECHVGCQIKQLVGDCVMPREGVFTRVLKGGVIKPGDAIRLYKNQEAVL